MYTLVWHSTFQLFHSQWKILGSQASIRYQLTEKEKFLDKEHNKTSIKGVFSIVLINLRICQPYWDWEVNPCIPCLMNIELMISFFLLKVLHLHFELHLQKDTLDRGNKFTINIPNIQKSVNWFAQKINWLVSIMLKDQLEIGQLK